MMRAVSDFPWLDVCMDVCETMLFTAKESNYEI